MDAQSWGIFRVQQVVSEPKVGRLGLARCGVELSGGRSILWDLSGAQQVVSESKVGRLGLAKCGAELSSGRPILWDLSNPTSGIRA